MHFATPILLGVSEPAYDTDQLKAFKANDNRKIEFEGKEYTGYEATQVQRKLETEMRRQKDRSNIAKAAGDDDMRREAQSKINLLSSKYKQFSDAAGLPTKMERARMAGYHKVKAKSELKTVAKSADSGIINKKDHLIINIQSLAKGADYSQYGMVQLRKSLNSLSKQIELHRSKLLHPENAYSNWSNFSSARQKKELLHWEKEISEFNKQITKIKNEIKRRE